MRDRCSKLLNDCTKFKFLVIVQATHDDTVERTFPILKIPHKGGILLTGMDLRTPQYSLLQLRNFELTIEWGDNCVTLSDKTVVKVLNFVMLAGIPHLIGRKLVELSYLYPAPFESTMLDI